MTDQHALYTRPEAADILRISTSTLSRMIAAGLVRSVRVGKQVRIPREEVTRILEGGSPPATVKAEHVEDESTWPPTPSMLADLDGRTGDEQADDDAAAIRDAQQAAGGPA